MVSWPLKLKKRIFVETGADACVECKDNVTCTTKIISIVFLHVMKSLDTHGARQDLAPGIVMADVSLQKALVVP